MTILDATTTLVLPCTGQTLRLALERRDLRMLDELTRHLRVAGYKFEPLSLAEQLLSRGCASVIDSFGHEVPVQVRVPRRETLEPRDETRGFLVAF